MNSRSSTVSAPAASSSCCGSREAESRCAVSRSGSPAPTARSPVRRPGPPGSRRYSRRCRHTLQAGCGETLGNTSRWIRNQAGIDIRPCLRGAAAIFPLKASGRYGAWPGRSAARRGRSRTCGNGRWPGRTGRPHEGVHRVKDTPWHGHCYRKFLERLSPPACRHQGGYNAIFIASSACLASTTGMKHLNHCLRQPMHGCDAQARRLCTMVSQMRCTSSPLRAPYRGSANTSDATR